MLRPFTMATETLTAPLDKQTDGFAKKMQVIYYNRSRHGKIKKVGILIVLLFCVQFFRFKGRCFGRLCNYRTCWRSMSATKPTAA